MNNQEHSIGSDEITECSISWKLTVAMTINNVFMIVCLLGTLCDVIVNKLEQETITNEFESHWLPCDTTEQSFIDDNHWVVFTVNYFEGDWVALKLDWL